MSTSGSVRSSNQLVIDENLNLLLHKIINLADGVDDTDAVTLGQLKALILALQSGMEYKGKISMATANIPNSAKNGWLYLVSVGGTQYGETWEVGNFAIVNKDLSGPATAADIDRQVFALPTDLVYLAVQQTLTNKHLGSGVTAITQDAETSNTTIATTEFVQNVVRREVDNKQITFAMAQRDDVGNGTKRDFLVGYTSTDYAVKCGVGGVYVNYPHLNVCVNGIRQPRVVFDATVAGLNEFKGYEYSLNRIGDEYYVRFASIPKASKTITIGAEEVVIPPDQITIEYFI